MLLWWWWLFQIRAFRPGFTGVLQPLFHCFKSLLKITFVQAWKQFFPSTESTIICCLWNKIWLLLLSSTSILRASTLGIVVADVMGNMRKETSLKMILNGKFYSCETIIGNPMYFDTNYWGNCKTLTMIKEYTLDTSIYSTADHRKYKMKYLQNCFHG